MTCVYKHLCVCVYLCTVYISSCTNHSAEFPTGSNSIVQDSRAKPMFALTRIHTEGL